MTDDDLDQGGTPVSPAGGERATKLITRLKRVEGQARGLQKMLAEGRSCDEVVIQLAAMKAAVNRIGFAVVGEYMADCLRCQEADGTGDPAYERALRLLMKLS